MKQPRFIMSGRFTWFYSYIIATGDAHVLQLHLSPPSKPLESPKGIQGATILPVGAPCIHDHTSPFEEVATSAWHSNCILTRVVTQTSSNSWCLVLKRPTKAAHRSCQSIVGGCSLSANHQTQFLRFVLHQSVFSHLSSDRFFWQHEDCETLLWSLEFQKESHVQLFHTVFVFDLSKWSMVKVSAVTRPSGKKHMRSAGGWKGLSKPWPPPRREERHPDLWHVVEVIVRFWFNKCNLSKKATHNG